MEIQNPRNKFFKAVISQIKYAKGLISIKLPEEMKTQIDWEGLRQEPGSFIDEDYKEHFTDALFSIPYKKKEVLIGILVEHKSHPDPKVFSQLLRYQSNIYSCRVSLRSKNRAPVLGASSMSTSTASGPMLALPRAWLTVNSSVQSCFCSGAPAPCPSVF